MSKKVDLNKFKDVVTHLKTKQAQLKHLVSKETIREAKKYAATSKAELQKLMKTTDAKKVRAFIEKEAKEFHKLQQSLPGEIAKFSKFVEGQKKEFEKVLKSVSVLDAAEFIQKKAGLGKKSKASSTAGRKSEAKNSATRKPKAKAAAAPMAAETESHMSQEHAASENPSTES